MSMSLQKLAKIWKNSQCRLFKFDVSDNFWKMKNKKKKKAGLLQLLGEY